MRRLFSDARGATAIEFALAAPIMIAMVIGVFQLGQLFFANAGIHHTVEQAARFAAVYPAPSAAEVKAKVHEGQVGLRGTLAPVVNEGTDSSGKPIFDISLSYVVPLDFIFFETPPVTLSHSRRVYRQVVATAGPATAPTTSAGGTPATSNGGTPTTSNGGTGDGSGGETTPPDSSNGGSNNSNGGDATSSASSSGNGNNGGSCRRRSCR